MSIGAAFTNWPQYPTAVAADNLVDAGVTVVTSIGNSGVNGGQLWSAGAPGVGRKVIGVASFDNTKATLPAFQVGAREVHLQPRCRLARHRPALRQRRDRRDRHPGHGRRRLRQRPGCRLAGRKDRPHPQRQPGTSGPTCGFYNKAINAQRAGAIAVVIYNNVAGALSPTVAPVPPGSRSRSPSRSSRSPRPTAARSSADWRRITRSPGRTRCSRRRSRPPASSRTSARSAPTPSSASSRTSAGRAARSTRPGRTSSSAATTRSAARRWPRRTSPGLVALILQAKHKSIAPAMVRTLLMNTALPKGLNIAPVAGARAHLAAGRRACADRRCGHHARLGEPVQDLSR